MVTDRLGAPWHFNAGHPKATGAVVAAPGLHGALVDELAVQTEQSA
jgi:hypothetical protein